MTRHLWEWNSLLTFFTSGDGKGFLRQALGLGHFHPFFSLTTQVFVMSGARKGMFCCQYDAWPCGLMGTFLETVLSL